MQHKNIKLAVKRMMLSTELAKMKITALSLKKTLHCIEVP